MVVDNENKPMFLFPLVSKADRGEHPFSQGQSMDQEKGSRKRQYGEMGGIVEGSAGNKGG